MMSMDAALRNRVLADRTFFEDLEKKIDLKLARVFFNARVSFAVAFFLNKHPLPEKKRTKLLKYVFALCDTRDLSKTERARSIYRSMITDHMISTASGIGVPQVLIDHVIHARKSFRWTKDAQARSSEDRRNTYWKEPVLERSIALTCAVSDLLSAIFDMDDLSMEELRKL